PRRPLVRRGVDPRGRRPLGPGATGAGLQPARGTQPRLVARLEPRWAPAGPRALRWRPVCLGPARGAIPARRAGARLEMTRGGLPRSTHLRPRGWPRRVRRGRDAFGATEKRRLEAVMRTVVETTRQAPAWASREASEWGRPASGGAGDSPAP